MHRTPLHRATPLLHCTCKGPICRTRLLSHTLKAPWTKAVSRQPIVGGGAWRGGKGLGSLAVWVGVAGLLLGVSRGFSHSCPTLPLILLGDTGRLKTLSLDRVQAPHCLPHSQAAFCSQAGVRYPAPVIRRASPMVPRVGEAKSEPGGPHCSLGGFTGTVCWKAPQPCCVIQRHCP